MAPEEIHWIIANGIKMSGMPAFGQHHGPEQIVALTAFVSALPGLTPEDYAMLAGAAAEHSGQATPPSTAEPER